MLALTFIPDLLVKANGCLARPRETSGGGCHSTGVLFTGTASTKNQRSVQKNSKQFIGRLFRSHFHPLLLHFYIEFAPPQAGEIIF